MVFKIKQVNNTCSVFNMTLSHPQLGNKRSIKVPKINTEKFRNSRYIFSDNTVYFKQSGPSHETSIVHKEKGKFTGRKMQLF